MLGTIRRLLRPRPPRAGEITYPHVSLYQWQPHDGGINFGDRLSEIIVRQLLCQRGLSLDDEVQDPARLFAVGSILHAARDGDHVWGSGINGKLPEEQALVASRLHVAAVRGPLTAELLRKRGIPVPDVYGDPALLLPTLFGSRFEARAEQDYVFVPNLYDLPLVRGQRHVVSPLHGWNRVISAIMKARLVLASSLHGLIVAEAFGIPARYVRLSATENLFKYEDYFYGSGRENRSFEYATSIEQGAEMGGMEPISFQADALLGAFPWHLWR